MIDPLKILFIHEVNYLKKPIFEMHEFPEHLAALGHDVYFLHFPENSTRQERSKLGSRTKLPGRVVSGSEITLLTPRIFSFGLLGRLFAALIGHSIVRKAIRDSGAQIVVTLAVPTFGWQAVRVSRKLGIPIVYRALDVSHLIRGGVFSPLVKLAEAFVARRASLVSANNRAMGNYIRELSSGRGDIQVHFPAMDLERFRSGDKVLGLGSLGLSELDHIVLYMGSFFYFSGLPEVIQEFASLARDKRYKLILIGGGELDSELRNLVTKMSLEDQVIFTGFVGFEELPDYLAAADVLINPMKKSLVSDTALPNKVIQYLATSIPIVCTDLKGVGLTFGQYDALHIVESPEECITKALQLAGQIEEADCTSNQQMLDRTFGPTAVKRFEQFLEQAVTAQ